MLPLLISKQKDVKFLRDDYKLGWLMTDENEGYWMIWGSSKNKYYALSATKDLFEKKGQCEVFISDEPLSKQLTKEDLGKLRKLSIDEIYSITNSTQ